MNNLKMINCFLLLFLTFNVTSQKSNIEVKNITMYNQYAEAIKSLCENFDEVDDQLKTEILSYSYHNILSQFKQNKKFKKQFTKSDETTTIAFLSAEYNIHYTYITLSVNSDTYLYSMNHKTNVVNFVCKEEGENSFLSIVELLHNTSYPCLVLLIASYPDSEGWIRLNHGLSLANLESIFILEKYIKNID